MTWALIEVRGGIAEVQGSDEVTLLQIDWDDLGDDRHYAAHALSRIDTAVADDFPIDEADRLRDGIYTAWPELAQQ